MTLAEMQALLAALSGRRFGGVRSITCDGCQITYGSGTELATAIFDLERRIATADTTMTPRGCRVPLPAGISDHGQLARTA